MSVPGINFISKTKIDAERQGINAERELLLEKAKEKYKEKERRAQERKERGEHKWLLPSVEDRLSSKKSKKHKKEKKKKKHKKKHEKSSDESNSGSNEVEWVESSKSSNRTPENQNRDDWMTMPPSLFPCVSREDLINQKSKPKKERQSIDVLGKTDRELNPYWKNGGTGLPSEKADTREKTVVGDGGALWLSRAYKRVLEQAEEQGKTPEEIAADRWGSLEKLERLIRDAEERGGSSRSRSYPCTRPSKSHNSFMRPDSISSEHSRHSCDSQKHKRTAKGWRKPKLDNSEVRKEADCSPLAAPDHAVKSDSSSEELEPKDQGSNVSPAPKIISEKEMNVLGARILKYELMGNQEMAEKLKKELEVARRLKSESSSAAADSSQLNVEDETVLLTRTSKKGVVRPLTESVSRKEPSGGRKKKQKVDTHDRSGERVRYFADDDDISLKEMFEQEKLGSAEDQNAMLARLAGRGMETNDDMDDVMVSRANKQLSQSRLHDQERSRAIFEHKKKSTALENCHHCFEGQKISKHMIIAIGIRTYLCLPPRQSLTEGHCLIVPMQHATCATQLDEDVWSEIQIFRKGLTKMFEDQDKISVFFETNLFPKKFPHMVLECVPMPREVGDLAPIYFKKAILESEKEWSQNKKLIDLSKTHIRRAIPTGLPYFTVDFGLQNGFAHVIEEEKDFSPYFAKEIIGGMMDLEPRLWRKPHWEKFDLQKKKVLDFSKWWKPYDWTYRLKETS